jgi:hypothetical protein
LEDEQGMIQRSDIEAKARQIESAINDTKAAAQSTAVLAGVAMVVVVILAFLFGRKKGKAGKAIVEVYRVK